MTKLEKATETTKKADKKGREKIILVFAIVIPIAIALLVPAGAAIWESVVGIMKVLVPSVWILPAYAYVLFIGILLGRISKKK